MTSRWHVLALLFVVRLSMSFQFQSVASVSPAMMGQYGIGLADMGFLIGLYLAPGIAFALPGGAFGRWLGDKEVVLVGLGLMVVGGVIMTLAPAWPWQIAGRIVAGMGGVLLNVLMSKMVTDWFAGKELATAMAIFVNSWPAGIALCLFVLPAIAAAKGVTVAFAIASAFCALGLLLFASLYRPPGHGGAAITSATAWPAPAVILAVVIAGCIWGLFNAAIAMVFGFGTAMLAERGWTLASAGSATSLVLWLVTLSVPLGGVLADRTGRPIAVMLAGFILSAVAIAAAVRTEFVLLGFALLGLVGGLSAGPIMSLPARVLAPAARATGMGIYFTLFYVLTVAAPFVAGIWASRSGSARAAFDLGAIMLALCLPAYWLFEWAAARAARPAST